MRWEAAARALEFAGLSGAKEAYQKAAELGPMNEDSWYRFGRLLEESEAFEEAIAAYKTAERYGRPAGHMAFRIARCLTLLKDPIAAAIEFRRSVEEGFDPQAAFLALESLQGSSAPKWIKLDLYREGQEHFSGADPWTESHARVAAEMRSFEEAEECYQTIRELRGVGASDAVILSEVLVANGDFSQARKVLENALDGLSSTEAAMGVGVLFQRARKWSRARTEYVATESSRGLNASLASRIALTFDREYRWADAAEYFEKAFRLDPADGQWAYKCGHAYERIGSLELAAKWYYEALNTKPQKLHWWYRLGVTLSNAGNQEGALFALRRSLKLAEPFDQGVGLGPRLLLPQAFFDVQSDSASSWKTWVMRACESGPWVLRSAPSLVEVASVALELGLIDQADFLATSASIESADLDAPTRLRLSCVLELLGRLDEAVEVLLDSRSVRTPDGVDLKIYLGAGTSRLSRQYAEYVSELPVGSKVVFFESNHGAGATCHPLALYREISHDARFSEHRFVWALKSADLAPRELLQDPRVTIVVMGSNNYLYHLATAAYLINNVSFPPYFSRRTGQRYLNTWHGTPMKSLGRSMEQGLVEYENLERNFIQASHLLAPNELTKWALLSEHHLDGIYPGSIQVLGSPRLDSLVANGAETRTRMRDLLGVSSAERLVLVAPTWRGGVSDQDVDVASLVEQLEAVAAVPGVRVLYRAHRLTEKLVAGLDLPVQVVPQEIDTNDLLAAVDHLVSDYSSIVFDFLVTGRPITLFVPDLKEYRAERGLYREPHELPVGVAHTLEELVEELQTGGSVSAEAYAAAALEFGPFEDGLAASRCVDFFLSDDLAGSELNGKQTVLFHASMIPNGIASALLAILEELVQLDLNVLLLVEPSVLRSESDRAGIFARLPEGVRLVSRVGETVMTPEEYYVRQVVEGRLCEPGPDMRRIYEESWRLEASRIVGELPLTAAIEWDGYATLWAGILSNVGQSSTRKLVWQHNEMEEEESHKYPELAAVFGTYPWYDAAVSVSSLLGEKNGDFVRKRDVSPKEGVFSVRNALPFDRIRELSTVSTPEGLLRSTDSASHTVVTVGRMSMEKNHLALVEAWPSVLTEFPRARLVIVGSGPLEARIVTLIGRLKLEDSIILTGQLPNPYPIINDANLFVLPSLHEGQPIVLFEAMCLGVGIAASGCPGNVEALNSGYGFRMGTSVDGIAEGIRECLRDPSRATGSFDTAAHRSDSVNSFLRVVLQGAQDALPK